MQTPLNWELYCKPYLLKLCNRLVQIGPFQRWLSTASSPIMDVPCYSIANQTVQNLIKVSGHVSEGYTNGV